MLQANRVSVYDHNDNNKKKWMDKRKNKNWIKIQYKPDIWYRLLDRIKDLSLYCRHRVVFRELYAGHITVIYLFFFFVQSDYLIILFIFLSFQLYLDDRGCHSMIMIILIQNDYLWIMITLIVHTHTHTHWL